MERLIGIDESLPDFVIGCDPGPEHCAFALIRRNDDGTLGLIDVAYPHWTDLIDDFDEGINRVVPFGGTCGVVFAYEKVTSRYGAIPGATTYDTCRNAGIAVARMVRYGVEAVYGLGTVDWRVALGGRTNLSDAETHAAIVSVLGEEQDKRLSALAKDLKKCYNMAKPIGCHLRDAVGVAIGAFLMKRHGTPVSAREVWHV